MKSNLRHLVLVVAVAVSLAFLAAGCKRPPTPPKGALVDPEGERDKKDSYSLALDSFRTPENFNGSEDIARFRDGLQALANHFSTPEIVKQTRFDDAERKFLEKDAHLSEPEFIELESATFRPADAHYLDECFLLRDVARSLEVTNWSPIDQANLQFRWVMRNVPLHEQADDWTPPAFTLRRGHGGPRDRAMVFLALLRQSNLEGCVLTVPKVDSRQILVGVLEPDTTNLRLFDPRLGLPVMSKDGKHIATLKEAQDDPALLAPSGFDAAQVKNLEARLICPLYALSPRMRVLDKKLNDLEPVRLHLDAAALSRDIGKASQLPVAVWNSPSDGKTMPNSPTRCLWKFLPRPEGGIDDGRRVVAYARSRLPLDNILLNISTYMNPEDLPRTAWQYFEGITRDLLLKYDLQPREMNLRGLRERMFRRQHRLEPFVKADIVLANDEIPKWLNRVRDSYASFDPDDPKQRAKAQQVRNEIWGKDLFIGRLIQVDKDEQFDAKDRNLVMEAKTELTKLLAIGLRDHFDLEIRRSQAAANFESAERGQALKLAEDRWDAAKSSANYYLGRVSLQGKIDQGRAMYLRRVVQEPQTLPLRINLIEALHLDVHRYFEIKLRLAECKVHTDPKDAVAFFESIKAEIETLERKGTLKDDVNSLSQGLSQFKEGFRPQFQSRLDLLANDWSERGNYYWMKQHIDRRIAALR